MEFGRYEKKRLLGKGGMSEVWEVLDAKTGARFALKSYAYPKDDPAVRARFEQEGRMLAAFDHPRIVKVVDVGASESTGMPYFVMNLVVCGDGISRTLADVPAEMLDEESVGRWYDDVREALAYAHGKGVVHRDLKLQNVMIGADGHAVVTDFGVSRVLARAGACVADPVQTLVRAVDGRKLVMGSVGYMAPELEMGCPATPQSDWYALGVIVYRLLTGTWCDARTNLEGTLESYDPVWLKIVPCLVHAHPEARTCPSYSEEVALRRARAEAAAEAQLANAARRLRRARRTSVAVVSAAVVLSALLGWRFRHAPSAPAEPDFEDLFPNPVAVGFEGDYDMAEYESYEKARRDALLATRELFGDLKRGAISRERAAKDLRKLHKKVLRRRPEDFVDLSPGYFVSGEWAAWRNLIECAVKKLEDFGK